MNVTYYLLGNKKYASIYLRIRDSKIDAKVNTGFKIQPKNFKKGQVKINKINERDAEKKKEIIKSNSLLLELQEKLNSLEKKVINAYQNKNQYEVVNLAWLKNVLTQNEVTSDIPSLFTEYFDFYIKARKKSMKPSTLKKIQVFNNRVKQYEKDRKVSIYIQKINKRFGLDFQEWCDEKGYAHNTKIQTLKTIKTVCNHASEFGIKISPEIKFLTKGLKSVKHKSIYLNFDEIDKIINLDLKDEKLDIARDWLVISCYTALRVSDNLKLTKDNIFKIEDSYFLQIIQQKTNKPVDIYLDDVVIKILKKRKMNFPPVFSKNVQGNETIYNRLIKDVCRLARINNIVTVHKKNTKTNRYEVVEMPKYRAVSSHIGRRSFATNYYGLIPTSLLIGQTGHSSEKQFLQYVGKKGNENSLLLAKLMKKIK